MKIQMSCEEVRSLCIRNDWFTAGSNRQYEKMFGRVAEHADIDEVATLIWICSVDVEKAEIANQLMRRANLEQNEATVSKERIEVVRAMETIARTVNNENIFMEWLTYGVADGDIREGTEDDELEYYTRDEEYSELMGTFLNVMKSASKSGGLYSDGVTSN
ncbi:MAG: hypothetical protein MJ071_00945 [Oscillospiraceae bacterium]|nr:hypothetical protein [Oscillospiraceae bacterium]